MVMPIWVTETSEKYVIDLVADLNTSDGASATSTHPVSPPPPPPLLTAAPFIISLDF